METRKEEFKAPFYKSNATEKLFKFAQESSRLRKQRIFTDKRLAAEEKKDPGIPIEQFYEYFKPVEELLTTLEPSGANRSKVLKSLKQLQQTLSTKLDQSTLKKVLTMTGVGAFLAGIINKWHKFSDILYESLKSLVVLSVVAYVHEEPFCELLPTLEEIMRLPNVNPNFILKELVVWIIGNMAGDCQMFIEFISKSAVFVPQVIELVGYKYDSLRATCLWCLNCLTKSELVFDKSHLSSPLLISEVNSILKKGKKENKEQAVWILVNLTQLGIFLGFAKAPAVIETLIVELDNTGNIDYCKGLLRCIGNLLAENIEEYTAAIAGNSKMYAAIEVLMKSEKIRKECLWILSLLAADPIYCQTIGDSECLVNFLISQLKENVEYQTRKEALLTLYYLASNAGGKYIKSVGNEGVIRFCIWTLETHMNKDVQMIMCVLSVIDLVVEYMQDARGFIKAINGKVSIEKMIYAYEGNEQISLLAQNIIQKLTNN